MYSPLFKADTMGSKEGLKVIISPGTNEGAYIELIYNGESLIYWRYAESEPGSYIVRQAAQAIANYYSIKEPIITLDTPLKTK